MKSDNFKYVEGGLVIGILCVFSIVLFRIGGEILYKPLECPPGQTIVGQFDKACIKIVAGAEQDVRSLYRVAELLNYRSEPWSSIIIFDKPMRVSEVNVLLAPWKFTCTKAYFYEPKSRLYGTRGLPPQCESMSIDLAKETFGIDESLANLDNLVILSVHVRGVPSDLREFWKQSTLKVRAVLIETPLPLDFKYYPVIEE